MKSRPRRGVAPLCGATKPAKVKYSTLNRAVKACARVFFAFATSRLNNIYRCAACGQFHLTTPPADSVGGQIASVVQRKEQRASIPTGAGSNPARRATNKKATA